MLFSNHVIVTLSQEQFIITTDSKLNLYSLSHTTVRQKRMMPILVMQLLPLCSMHTKATLLLALYGTPLACRIH